MNIHQLKIIFAVILTQIAIYNAGQMWALFPIMIALLLMIHALLDVSFIQIKKYKIGKFK